MIVRVWARAVAAGLGPVVVAVAEPEIARAVEKAGGTAVMTDPDLPSGSDRIWAALAKADPQLQFALSTFGEAEELMRLRAASPTTRRASR